MSVFISHSHEDVAIYSAVCLAFDGAGINWGHIALAQMMRAGYVDRVLTVNFDTILHRACTLLAANSGSTCDEDHGSAAACPARGSGVPRPDGSRASHRR